MAKKLNPTSKFLRVACPKCQNKQIIFERATTKITCNSCKETLAEPTGGKANIIAQILEQLS